MSDTYYNDLKPCPMCGGMAMMFANTFPGSNAVISSYEVFCTRCGLNTKKFGEEKTAVEAWDRRVTDDIYFTFAERDNGKRKWFRRMKDDTRTSS